MHPYSSTLFTVVAIIATFAKSSRPAILLIFKGAKIIEKISDELFIAFYKAINANKQRTVPPSVPHKK